MEEHNPDFFQDVFERTQISRSPLSGIVKGYHRLPYVLVGPNDWENQGSVELRGEIRVSPRLVYTFNQQNDPYTEIFEEHEPIMDQSIIARTFRFKMAQIEQGKRIKIEGSTFSLSPHMDSDEMVLARVLDELSSREVIDTGVIWCPNPKFYPISLERFIHSIIDKEMGIN